MAVADSVSQVRGPAAGSAALRELRASLSTPSRRLQLAVKRAVDLAGAAAGLIVGAPFLALLAALIRLDSPGPATFSQSRLGRDGRVFRMHKFRTMVDGAQMALNPDGSTRVTQHDPRLTRMGARLRPKGLDELPQLVNVLRGEMSLIGPRPDHDFQLQHYAAGDCRKLAMRPGITSLAQVSGRNALPWRRRTELEIYYVDHFTLWLDLQIAWRTVGVALQGAGAYNPEPDEGPDSPALAGKDR